MFLKTNYWNNYYIKSLNNDEKNIISYLSTNEYTNYTGIIKISNKIIAEDLNLSIEDVNNALSKFANDNICYFDSETNYIIFNKCEFLSFRENLNLKTEMKLKSIFNNLPTKIKDAICVKFADLKPYFSEKKSIELTKNIISNLAEFKSIIGENDGVAVKYLISIKNQLEILINDMLEPQNEFSPQYYSYNINNIKNSTENKIKKNNTPSNKKIETKNDTPKTKRGRPKKETKIYEDHFIIRDGKQFKLGRVQVERLDVDGKQLYKPKSKYFKSVVKPEDVNYDKVKNMFLSYTKGWSKEGIIAVENVVERYYSKRKSQNWIMNRTLEQDIQKWFNDDFTLKPYRKMSEKTQTIENIENKFNELKEAENEFNRNWNGLVGNRTGGILGNIRNFDFVGSNSFSLGMVVGSDSETQRDEEPKGIKEVLWENYSR